MAIVINSFTPSQNPAVVPENTTLTLTVNATETTSVALLYQWERKAPGTTVWSNVTGGSGATTSSYTTPVFTASDNNAAYRVRVYTVSPAQQSYAPSVDGTTIQVVPPTLLLNTTPLNATYSVVSNGTLQMTVASTFSSESIATVQSNVDGITYQWQVSTNGGSTWSNVSAGGSISISNTTTLDQLTPTVTQYYRQSVLTYTNIPASQNLAQYRVLVSSSLASNSPLTTTSGTVLVNSTISISKQPGSSPDVTTINKYNPNISGSGSTTLTVTASTTAGSYSTLSYLWQYQTASNGAWSDITVSNLNIFIATNFTTADLSLSQIGFETYLKFRCIVSGTANEPAVTTNEAILTINQTVVMATNVAAITVAEGTGTSFTALVDTNSQTGTSDQVQTKWQRKDPGSSTWNDLTSYVVETNPFYTTPTLSNAIDDGAYYRLQVDGVNCTNEPFYSPNSTGALLTVYRYLSITTDPSPITVYPNQTASFGVIVNSSSPTTITYQWQVKTTPTGDWTNLTNNTTYSGVTTASLFVNSVTSAFNGYYYRVIVNGTNVISTVTSAEALLSVINDTFSVLPSINDVNLSVGQSLSYSVTAQSASLGAISYQWQKSTNYNPSTQVGTWSNITGATSSTFNITSVQTTDQGYYRVRVTSSGGTVAYSNAGFVNIVVLSIDIVGNFGSTVTVLEGDENAVTFSVTATPTVTSTLSYQWEYNQNPTGSIGWSSFGSGYLGSVSTNTTYTPNALLRSQSGLRIRCKVTGTDIPGNFYSSECIIIVDRKFTYSPIPTTVNIAPNEFRNINLFPLVTGGIPTYQWQYRTGSTGTWTNISGYTTEELNIIGFANPQSPTAGAFVVNANWQIRCLVTLADANKYEYFTASTGLVVANISPAGSQFIVNDTALTATINITTAPAENVKYSFHTTKNGAAIGTLMCIPKPGDYVNPGSNGSDDSMLWNKPHSSVSSSTNANKLKYDRRFPGWIPISASALMSSSNNTTGAMLNAEEFPELARILGNAFGGSLNTFTSTTGYLPARTSVNGNHVTGTFATPLVFGKKLFGTGAVNNNAAGVAVIPRFAPTGVSGGTSNSVGSIGGAYNYMESEQLPPASGGTAGTSTINPSTFTLGNYTTTGWSDAQKDIVSVYNETVSWNAGPLGLKTFTSPTVHSHQMTSYTQVPPSQTQKIGRWSYVGANDACKEMNASSGEAISGIPYVGATIGHIHGLTQEDAAAEGTGHNEGTGGVGSATLPTEVLTQNQTGTFVSNGLLVMSNQSNSIWNSAISFTLQNADKLPIITPHFRLKYYIKAW